MNTRNSAIVTSVNVLVTVMPRYNRSILSSILEGRPRSGVAGAGTDRDRYAIPRSVRCTVKLILLSHRRKHNPWCPFALVPKIKIGQSLFQLGNRCD
jgi:hypothetical protein